jgi:hypothetical protein
MKCPKCGYISFDNNQVCPKCNRDISYEQEKLNFPAFRPNPPSLLGALTGEVIESHVDMQIDQSYSEDVSTDIVTEEDVNYEDSGVIDMGEVTFDDSGALDRGDIMFNDPQMDVDLELGETNEFEAPDSFDSLPQEESVADLDLDSLNDSSELMMSAGGPEIDGDEGISLAMDDLVEEEAELEGMEPLESNENEEAGEVSFNVGDLSLEGSDSMGESEVEEPEEESEEPGIDFDSMGLEESDSIGDPEIGGPEEEAEAPGIDFDSMASEEDEEAGDEVELGLDDLQIDESGELEIRSEADNADSETETLLDLEDIDLELDMDEEDK